MLVFAGSAAAVEDGGSAGGSNAAVGTGTGGAGTVSGQITWYDLEKLGYAVPGVSGGGGPIATASDITPDNAWNITALNYPGSALDSLRSGPNSSSNDLAATKDVLNACRSGSPTAAQCPYFYNTGHQTSGLDTDTWKHVHTPFPTGNTTSPMGELVAYNVKIWREAPNHNGWVLLFARVLGAGDSDYDTGKSAMDAQKIWWWGHTENPAGNGVYGGSFSNPGYQVAGAIGNYPPGSNARAQCEQNWARGGNGTRLNVAPRNNQGEAVGTKKIAQQGGGFPSLQDPLPPDSCYWEGSDIGATSFNWNAYKNFGIPYADQRGDNLPDDEFGSSAAWDNYGVTGKGLKEAIYLHWHIPLSGSGNPSISYAIQGAPGLYYAIQIVGVDGRDQIIPFQSKATPSGSQGFLWGGNGSAGDAGQQYFKVFVASPVKGSPKPGGLDCAVVASGPLTGASACTNQQKKPTDNTYPGNAPSANVTLDADSPVQTGQPTDQEVDVTADQEDDDQALFPLMTKLIHYTPQMRFSSPNAADSAYGPYGNDYIHYADADTLGLSSACPTLCTAAPAQFSAPQPAGRPPFGAEEVQLTRPAQLSRGNDSASWLNDPSSGFSYPLSSSSYGMTWLQPTLESPCPSDPLPIDMVIGQNLGWPASPQSCPVDAQGQPAVFNAWDDLLMAQAWWEARWVDGLKDSSKDENATGRITGQYLRCSDGAGSATPPAPAKIEDCQNPWYGLLSGVIGDETQYAQGYLNLQGAGNNNTTGSVRVVLQTNRPQSVVGSPQSGLIPRDPIAHYDQSGNADGTQYGPVPNYMNVYNGSGYGTNGSGEHGANGLINTGSGNIELNYCQQGIPSGSWLSIPGASDQQTGDAQAGDPECRGFNMRWYWPEPSDSDYIDSCNATNDTNPPHEPVNKVWPDVPRIDTVWGQYGSSERTGPEGYAGGQHSAAYNPTTFNGSPYVGKRPGKNGGGRGDNYKECTILLPAHYKTGRWDRVFSFKPLSEGNGNCQYHRSDIAGLQADKPNAASDDGYGTQCSSYWYKTVDGKQVKNGHKWAFGYWYPNDYVHWEWTGSAQFGVSIGDTDLAPGAGQRGQGQFWATPPSGNDDKGGASHVIRTGPNTKDPSLYLVDDSTRENCVSGSPPSGWTVCKWKNGYLDNGQWVLNQGAQPGWGVNNSGSELVNAGYIADFKFSWPSMSAAAGALAYNSGSGCPGFMGGSPGTCWALSADYDGFTNRQWWFQPQTNNALTASQYIKVYGPRNSR